MSWTPLMREAAGLALERHDGQLDKAGQPYILHPLAVAKELYKGRFGEEGFIAGVLHDTVEDTQTTVPELVDIFGGQIGGAVAMVSRLPSETYAQFITRIKTQGSELAIAVKIADLKHNMSPERTASLPPELQGITRRYKNALATLEL